MKKTMKRYSRNAIIVVFGTFVFTLGISLFITPLHLYSGGVMGFSQVLRTLLSDAGIHFPFEISGIINFILNVPLMILAYRNISKRFFFLTILSVLTQTLFLAIIPVLQTPILDDILASCLVGGIISGFGIGCILRARGSGGGLDILGVFFYKKIYKF